MKKSITAIVLAAGKSSRMDEYKLTKILEGKPLISYTLDTVKDCDFYEVIVVYERDEVRELAESYNFKTIQNTQSHLGQSSSIILGTKIASECDGFIYIIGDQPFISRETLIKMKYTFEQSVGFFVSATLGGKRCSPVIFPSAYKADLLNLTGDIGGRSILKSNSDKILLCECIHEMEAFDLDTIFDFDIAVNYLKNKS